MKKQTHKLLAVLLAVIMILSVAPNVTFTASAAGNSISTATSISLGYSYSGELTSSNKNDYYKFTLSNSGSITINCGLQGSTHIIVYDSRESTVYDEYSPAYGTSYSETVHLTSGTYYLRFNNFAANNGNYNFKLFFTSANESFAETQGGSNNTIATASSISIGNTYYGQIALNDRTDYYKFTLSKPASLIISCTLQGATKIGIYNTSNSKVWEEITAAYGTSYSKTIELSSGTYYLLFNLLAYYAMGPYNFKLSVSDNTNPTGQISSTNNASASQTATLYLYDNIGVAGYYWGTSSSYSSNSYSGVSSAPTSTSVTKTVSSAGTYYLTVKDTAGNLSTTYSVTYYKTTLNANGGSVSPSYVITKSGNSFTFPTPTKSGYEYKGWSTSPNASSGTYSISPGSNTTYYAVWKEPVVLSSISVYTSPNKTTYYIGDSLNTAGLKIKLTYSDNSTETISNGFTTSGFSSSATGTKTVTVSYGGKTTSFNVSVKAPTITLSYTSKSMAVDDTATLTATTTPSGQTVTWTSSDTNVAVVSGGDVTATGTGSATITAKFTYNGYSYTATCNITATIPVAGFTLNHTTATVETGDEIYVLTPIFTPENATNQNVNYTSSDNSIATVSGGVVTILKYGEVLITATSEEGNFVSTCKLKIICSHCITENIDAENSTCIEHGHDAYTICKECNEIISGSDTPLPYATHEYTNSATLQYLKSVATCISPAIYYKSCIVCGEKSTETFEYGTIDANNHTGDTQLKNAKSATCTENGCTGDTYCCDCGVKFENGETIPALGHDYIEMVTDPTCTKGGFTTFICRICAENYVDDYTDPLGHTESDWIIDIEPTIHTGGARHTECTFCGKTLQTDTIPDSHKPGDINSDDKVNNKDLTRLFQYLSKWNVEVNEAALDINGDGKVNNKDLTRLFQYLSKWDVEIF